MKKNQYKIHEIAFSVKKKKYLFSTGSTTSIEAVNNLVNSILQIQSHMKKLKISKNDIKVVFDIGANVGIASSVFSTIFSHSKIYAFEPIENSYNILIENIENNNLIDRFECHNFGFYSLEGTFKMYIPFWDEAENFETYSLKENLTNYKTNKTKQGLFAREAKMKKLDDFVSNSEIYPDLVKIDVERSELALLKLGTKALEKCKIVMIELPNENIKVDSDTKECTNILTNLGFKDYGYIARHDKLFIRV